MSGFRFDSLAALFAMDGHGFYVWLCVALAVMVIFANVYALRRARRTFLRDARARLARREARLATPTQIDPATGNPI